MVTRCRIYDGVKWGIQIIETNVGEFSVLIDSQKSLSNGGMQPERRCMKKTNQWYHLLDQREIRQR